MYCRATKYLLKENLEQFENLFSRSGEWFSFFEDCDDYLGHEILRNETQGSYLILEKWMSKEDYLAYLQSRQAEYELLHHKVAELQDASEILGDYTILQ